jgi:hypothetical protein
MTDQDNIIGKIIQKNFEYALVPGKEPMFFTSVKKLGTIHLSIIIVRLHANKLARQNERFSF